MDDTTLASLRAALAQSPDNEQLLLVLLRAYLTRGEPDVAAGLLEQHRQPPAGEEGRELAARVWLASGKPQAVLPLTEAGPPALRVLRARALLALGREAEARASYAGAIADNPTLEDKALAAQLHARVPEAVSEAGRPRLRVISNDDTDVQDVDRLLAPAQQKVRFADVGGLSEIKSEIHKRIILPFQKPSLFARFRKRVGGGILMFGPPGCGKTLLARATAGECDATFFSVSISDILDMYIGESERKLHAIFEKARADVPAVMFFDEIEGLAAKRQFSREGNAAKLVSQFLAELDGFAKNNQGVLVMGATNVPWAVDPAFRRPGRFDRTLFVPPPDREARESILRLHFADRPSAGIDYATLAKRTQAFSGADLEQLVEAGADAAIQDSLERGSEVAIEMKHCNAALETIKNTTIEWLTTARNYARYANEGGQYDEVLRFLERHGK
jgi:transitional endoplasmic reticulum ATPase